MTTTHKVDTCKSACGAYGLDGVDLGTKAMTEVMAASDMGHKWASDILEADQAQITHSGLLTPNNINQNIYGGLRLGIQANFGFSTSDTTVRTKLQSWLQNLREDFPGVATYTPKELKQRASNLKSVADCVEKNTKTLASTGELTVQDTDNLTNLVEGMRSMADGILNLHKAVCAGPGIETVSLNIQPQKH